MISPIKHVPLRDIWKNAQVGLAQHALAHSSGLSFGINSILVNPSHPNPIVFDGKYVADELHFECCKS